MPSFLELAWIIPFSPLLGTFVLWLSLVSFNRTTNRLTKPVSYLLIICVGLSTLISFLLYSKHLSGQELGFDLIVFKLNLHFGLYLDNVSTLASAIFGLIALMIMIFSYKLMDRQKGYVSYFLLLGLLSVSIFSFILNGDLLHSVF